MHHFVDVPQIRKNFSSFFILLIHSKQDEAMSCVVENFCSYSEMHGGKCKKILQVKFAVERYVSIFVHGNWKIDKQNCIAKIETM